MTTPVGVAFDPAVHLCFEPPKAVQTMKDLALGDAGISPIGVTDPFPLFNKAGVTELRRNVLSEAVLEK